MTEKKPDMRLRINNPNAGQAAAKARARNKNDEVTGEPAIEPANSEIDKDNPFQIVTDLVYQGRGDISNTQLLIKQVEKLEAGNMKMSVMIPLSICDKKNVAQNLITSVKRYLQETGSTIVLGTRFFEDKITKQFLGARIWRLK